MVSTAGPDRALEDVMRLGGHAAAVLAGAVAIGAGPSAQTMQINGAGATFPNPIYSTFYENPDDKAQAKTMVDFMKWALTDGQKFARELGYAPLPDPSSPWR
jgi:phosphate transport system substrate-binding protein